MRDYHTIKCYLTWINSLAKEVAKVSKDCVNCSNEVIRNVEMGALDEEDALQADMNNLADNYRDKLQELGNISIVVNNLHFINLLDDQAMRMLFPEEIYDTDNKRNEAVNFKLDNHIDEVNNGLDRIKEGIKELNDKKTILDERFLIKRNLQALPLIIKKNRTYNIFNINKQIDYMALCFARNYLQYRDLRLINGDSFNDNLDRRSLERKYKRIGVVRAQLDDLARKLSGYESNVLSQINSILAKQMNEYFDLYHGIEERNTYIEDEPLVTYTEYPGENERTIEIIPLPAYTNNLELNNNSNNVPYGQNSNVTETITNNLNASNDRNLEVENPREASNNTTHFRRLI